MKLIDKSALVAEIERRIKTNKECMLGLRNLDYYQGKVDALNDTLFSLDTLEVKEVDLNEEIEKCLKKHSMIAVGKKDFTDIAKHFFELGLFSQLTWKDIRLISEIGEDFMNSEESDDLSEEEYYTAILNKLKEKGRDYKTGRQEIRDLAQKGE